MDRLRHVLEVGLSGFVDVSGVRRDGNKGTTYLFLGFQRRDCLDGGTTVELGGKTRVGRRLEENQDFRGNMLDLRCLLDLQW